MRGFLAAAVAACMVLTTAGQCVSKPNMVVMLMDDLGWADVSYGGTRDPVFQTPTIDQMNQDGIRMLSTYTPPNCSPSRHCFFSGYYPYRFGNQDNGISVSTTGHPPLNLKMFPEKLRELNYRTHMIGKWHQGFCEWEQTPINRGFSSWLGFYLGKGDHYTHFGKKDAYDLRFAERPDDVADDVIMEEIIVPPAESNGVYSTTMFSQRAVDIINDHATKYGTDGCTPFFIVVSHAAVHGPNQVPDRFLEGPCGTIPDVPVEYSKKMKELDGRRIKCGMMAAVDEGLKNITDALTATGQMDNTLIAFTSDNGGSWTQGSSNWPLKGGKTTLWEGGTRVPSFLYSSSSTLLPHRNWDWNGLHYQNDWFPTLACGFAEKSTDSKCGGDVAIDGYNHYNSLFNGLDTSVRTEYAYLNEVQDNHAVLRQNNYKLVVNQSRYAGWYLPPGKDWADYPWTDLPEGITAEEPRVKDSVFLFDIVNDPSETVNLLTLQKPSPPADMVKPDRADFNLDPKPVKPTDTSDPDYKTILAQFKEDLAAWKVRKAEYGALLADYKAKRAAYLDEKAQWETDSAQFTAMGEAMLNHLQTEYKEKLWVPTNIDKKLSNPEALDYFIEGTDPKIYVWSPGWCDNDVPDTGPQGGR